MTASVPVRLDARVEQVGLDAHGDDVLRELGDAFLSAPGWVRQVAYALGLVADDADLDQGGPHRSDDADEASPKVLGDPYPVNDEAPVGKLSPNEDGTEPDFSAHEADLHAGLQQAFPEEPQTVPPKPASTEPPETAENDVNAKQTNNSDAREEEARQRFVLRVGPDPLMSVRPGAVRAFVNSLCRYDWTRRTLFEQAEDALLEEVYKRHRDAAAIEAVWQYALHPSRWPEARRWLRRLRDDIVRVKHHENLYRPTASPTLPAYAAKSRVIVGPELSSVWVRESPFKGTDIGYLPFMEVTPPEVILHDLDVLGRKRGVVLPRVLDLTAGSGTSLDLCRIRGLEVIACDLTPCHEQVVPLHARDVGRLPNIVRERLVKESAPFLRRDLILLDPPSRGTPTHAEVYEAGGCSPDLAALPREAYLATLVDVTRWARTVLSTRGLVSVLLRCSTRSGREVTADLTLADDFLGLLRETEEGFEVVERLNVQWHERGRVRQAGLGTSRPPMAVRLLLSRRPS